MFSIFSFSDNSNMSSQPLDLQLLSEDELLSVWEQTQFAELVLTEKGVPPKNINQYARLVEAEIQSRAMQDNNALVTNAILNKEPYKTFAVSEASEFDNLDFF